ncbi:MAG: shikimate kinase [Erysipelotrichaceae bacterium]
MEIKLIGNPLKHSFSKQLHNLLADYDYQPVELSEEDFADFVNRKGYDGLNVTIPYKTKIIPFLDEIDPKAKELNSVNTVVNKQGILTGYNTDYYGFEMLMKKNQIDVGSKNVCILGQGGTAKTIYQYCLDNKANIVDKAHYQGKNGLLSYQQLFKQADKYQILINTTPVGMYPNNEQSAIELEMFVNLEAVVDVIYNPINTKLVIEAQKRGLKTATGLYMLVAQGEFCSSIFENRPLNYQKIDEVYNKLLFQKRNIVFIGMPTSGKTTFGKLLADKLQRSFFDCDIIIQQEEQMSIKEIFALKSEEYFRMKEHQIIKELAKKNSCVISTGGGAVLNSDNIDLLRQNGLILLLERELSLLFADANRPTVSSFEQLAQLYEQRYDLYQNSNDLIIVNDKSIEEILNRIMAVIE